MLADQVATNYRKAEITPRQRAMLDFAIKAATHSEEIEDADFAALGAAGFGQEDIWGTSARHRGVLRDVEPARQRDEHSAER